MSLFNGQDLFASGPQRWHVGGLALRHVLQETAGGGGVQLTAQGKTGRAITQTGDLLADDPCRLGQLSAAIEAQLDGCAHTLRDDAGRTWLGVVMLSFEPDPVRRVGTRWALTYRIQYLQVTP